MLRIPDSYDAKIATIYNLWTFWHVIQTMLPVLDRWRKPLHGGNLIMPGIDPGQSTGKWGQVPVRPSLPVSPFSLLFTHLWSVGQKCFLADFEKMVYWLKSAESQAKMSRGLQIFAILAS